MQNFGVADFSLSFLPGETEKDANLANVLGLALAWEKADFGPEKESPRIDFDLTGKAGQEASKNRKNGSKVGFPTIFPVLDDFSLCSGEAKIDCSAISFFCFAAGGPKSAFSHRAHA